MNLVGIRLADAAAADLRRAALFVHSMPAEDRRWLLDQLRGSERSRLAPLLEELHSLGIPADARLVTEALEAPIVPPDSPVQSRTTSTPLDDLPHTLIVQALSTEPDGLIIAVLRCGPWPWQAELFAALTPARRRTLEAMLRAAPDEPARAPALGVALLHGLRSRAMQSRHTNPTGPSQHAAWHRLWRRAAARFGGQRP